jgi:hypothetical protein
VNYDPDGNPITMDEWLVLWAERDHHIAFTEIGGAEVSTVWLGFDYSFGQGVPLIYESMVFGGPHDHTQRRYPNRDAALAGHDQLVAMVRDSAPDPTASSAGRRSEPQSDAG